MLTRSGRAALRTVRSTATPDGHTLATPVTSTRQRWRPPLPMATPRLHRDRWARPAGNVRVSYRMACASAARSVGRSQATALMRVPGPSSGMTAQPSPTASCSTTMANASGDEDEPDNAVGAHQGGGLPPGCLGQSAAGAGAEGRLVDVHIEAEVQTAGPFAAAEHDLLGPVQPGRRRGKRTRDRWEKWQPAEAMRGCRCESRDPLDPDRGVDFNRGSGRCPGDRRGRRPDGGRGTGADLDIYRDLVIPDRGGCRP